MNPLALFFVWCACWLYVMICHVIAYTLTLLAMALLHVAWLAFYLKATRVGAWCVFRAERLIVKGVQAIE